MKSYFALLMVAGFLLAQSTSTLPIRGFSPEQSRAQHDLESQAVALTDATHVRGYAKRMSSEPHIAGSPQSKAVAEYLAGIAERMGTRCAYRELRIIDALSDGADPGVSGAEPVRRAVEGTCS